MFNLPQNPQQLLQVRELINQGDLQQALALVEQLKSFGKSIELLELETEIREAIVTQKQTPEEKAEMYFDRGNQCYSAGDFEGAIEFFDKTVEINPSDDQAWYNRGLSLYALNQCEEAIKSFDKAIEFNPGKYEAWAARGISLVKLGRKEEAIESYDKAIKFKSDYHTVWHDRGLSLSELGRQEKAIESYDSAVSIKSDYHIAWYSRGISLDELGRQEEAITSYEKAIEIKSDYYKAWYNSAISLSELGRQEEAIASNEKAIESKPDYHQAWSNRSFAAANSRSQTYFPRIVLNQRTAQLHLKHPELTQRGYEGGLASLTIGLQCYCPADTHPLGHGYLQRSLGNAYRDHAKFQSRLHPDWSKALTAYRASLRCLTEYPAELLLTLEALIRTHLALNEIPQARTYQLQAIDLYNQLRNTAKDKRQFELQHRSLSRLEIDLLIGENDPTRALQQAEFYKNRHLNWILDDWRNDPPNPLEKGEPDNTLNPENVASSNRNSEVPLFKGDLGGSGLNYNTAIVYWHLSDDALTTFILTHDNESPLVSDRPEVIVLEVDRYNAANKLNELLKDYKREYQSYRQLKKDATAIDRQNHPWRQHLSQHLKTLNEILNIGAIEAHLKSQKSNIQNLILIPHRDLNLFPIDFPNYITTYLPSIRIGIESRTQTPPIALSLLNIDDPTTDQTPLTYARIESAILRALIPNHTKLNNTVTQETTIAHLQQPHNIFHFSGHGTHEAYRPENSGILLTGGLLTFKTIAQLDLSPYHLISLAACETGITATDKHQGEYIGLSSAFLKAKANTILSTLWQVDELSALWLSIKFYQTYLSGQTPATSLSIAQTWLKTLTYPELITWLETLQQLTLNDHWQKELDTQNQLLRKEMSRMDPTHQPYNNPYHWAGFTLTGLSS